MNKKTAQPGPAGPATEHPARSRGRPRLHAPSEPRVPEPAPPLPPERGRAHPGAPSHEVAIHSWSQVCLTQPKPMALSSVRANAVLWGAWCTWLAGRALHWSDATAQTVSTFLSGPAPSLRRRHRPARNPAQMSSLTAIRYMRVLKGVYANACALQWIEENPAEAAPQPEYVAKDAQGGVLPPGVLARLQNTRQLQQTFATDGGARGDGTSQWWVLRDRAAVALVAECGITTAELIALQLRDLGAGAHNIIDAMAHAAQTSIGEGQDAPGVEIRPASTGTPNLHVPDPAVDNPAGARMPAAPVVLTVRPSRTLNGRSFVLPARVCEVLLPWVALRQRLLTQMAARQAPLSKRREYLQQHGDLGPLFPSRQGRRAEGEDKPRRDHFHPMEPAAVYLIFKRAFAGLNPESEQGGRTRRSHSVAGEHPPYAQGTSVIRNTLIQHWLRTMPEEDAQKRAGFKTLEGMRVIARVAGITTQSTAAQDLLEQADANAAIDKNPHPGQKAERRTQGGRA